MNSDIFDAQYVALFLKTVPLVFAAIFPVLNPIGSAIMVLPMTTGVDQKTRHTIARAVARNTLLLLTIVLVAGSPLLTFFGISVPVVQATGGLVLASMGWKMLSAEDGIDNEKPDRPTKPLEDQMFYPFTFPVTVGPGSVAVTLTLSAHTTLPTITETVVSQTGALVAFIGLAVTVYLSFAYTPAMLRKIGPSASKVVMRLMAFIILCIGAQISWTGFATLIAHTR